MILLCVLAFISGMFVDGTAVFWVHYSERNDSVKTGLIGMLQAAAQVVGIGNSIHSWYAGIFYVIGYGAGSILAIKYKKKINESN